jgi:hypothetical protein
MIRLKLEESPRAVREFVRDLVRRPEVVEFEDDGRVLLRILAAPQLSAEGRPTLLEQGRDLVRRARKRNQDVPPRTVEQEVRQAVHAVRAKLR